MVAKNLFLFLLLILCYLGPITFYGVMSEIVCVCNHPDIPRGKSGWLQEILFLFILLILCYLGPITFHGVMSEIVCVGNHPDIPRGKSGWLQEIFFCYFCYFFAISVQ